MKGDHSSEGYDWVSRLREAAEAAKPRSRHEEDCTGWPSIGRSSGDVCNCGKFFLFWDISLDKWTERLTFEWDSPPKAQPGALTAKQAKAPVAGGVVQLFPRSMHILAMLSKAGANKYGTTVSTIQFLDTPGAYEMHTDAMVRHIVDEALEGPVNHKDNGALHAAQAAWNALARLEVFLKDTEESNGTGTNT